MSASHIDLLGEHSQILESVRTHFLASLKRKDSANLKTSTATTRTHSDPTTLLGPPVEVQIDCYAKAQTTAKDWLTNVQSNPDQSRTLFLICPTEFAVEDESPMRIWRQMIDQATRDNGLRAAPSLALQVIRGTWSPQETRSSTTQTRSNAVQGLARDAYSSELSEHAFGSACEPTLLANASYAFANISKHFGYDPKRSEEKEENFRPLPKSLNNYACEKCSDPECEHKLFGFLSSN